MNGFNDTVWELSRCDAEGCESEGTEEFGNLYLCLSCYISRMTRPTHHEDTDG